MARVFRRGEKRRRGGDGGDGGEGEGGGNERIKKEIIRHEQQRQRGKDGGNFIRNKINGERTNRERESEGGASSSI